MTERVKLHKKIYQIFKHRFNTLDSLYHFFIEPYSEEFSINEIKDYWEKFLSNSSQKYLNFYIHIPFCKSKCAYCMYYSWTDAGENFKKFERYINYLEYLFKIFSDIFSKHRFANLYIGGGSPNILLPNQIEKLLKNLFYFFSFEKEGQKTFEMNPNLATLEKLLIVKKFGFNRISFGVQSTNPTVLKINQRKQTWANVKKAVLAAKKLGFEVNVDLMLNLAGDKPQYFYKSLKDVASIQPDTITIYTLLPSKSYAENFLNCSLKKYYEQHSQKIKKYLEILKRAEKEINFSGEKLEPLNPLKFNFGLRNLKSELYKKINFEEKKVFLYPGEVGGRKCFSTFGLGFTARSHIFSLLEYEQFPEYIMDLNKKAFEGKKISLKEEMILFLLDNFEFSFKISLSQFKKEFGISLKEAFPLAFFVLKKYNKIKIKGDYLYFCPENLEEKFVFAMFFLDENMLVQKINSNKIITQKNLNFLKKACFSTENLKKELKQREKAEKEKRWWVRLTKTCNNRCIFCLDSEVQDGTFIPFEEIKQRLIEGKKSKCQRLILSGGEPTIHPQFLEIVKIGKKLGYEEIQVISNGRMFAYLDFLKTAIKNGVSEITFSIHGHTPELHDTLTQVRGSFFQSVVGLLNALKTSSLVVNVDIVLNKLNYKYLPEILKFFIELGVKEFDLLQIVPFGRAWENRRKLFYDIEKALPFLRKAFKLAKEKNVFLWTNRFPPCYLEGFEYLIQSPIKIFDEVRGREDMFLEFLKNKNMMKCFGERCRFCFLEEFCKDLIEIKNKGKLEGKKLAFCLEKDEENGNQKVLKLKMPLSKKFLEKFTAFYINQRYFIKGKNCKQCKFFLECEGAPVEVIREKGFSVLKPQ